MAMWQGDVSDPWPDDQQPTSQANDVTASNLGHVADLVDKAEAVLAATDPVGEADAAERRRGDQLLVEAILKEGLGGKRHYQLEDALIRYAVPVLKHLMQTGEIVPKCAELERPIGDADGLRELSAHDRDELVRDVIAEAMLGFAKAVFEERRWSPDGGASLKTYFVNACLRQFSTLYRKWWSNYRRIRPEGLEIDLSARASADPASVVSATDEVVRLLRKTDDRQTQEVLLRRGLGDSAQNAASKAGLSSKAAEGRVARLREKLRKGTQPPSGEMNREDGGRFQ